MKKHLFLSRAIALATLATLPVIFLPTFYSFADSPGNFSDSQVQSLKSLGIPIPVPIYIPKGFTLHEVTIHHIGDHNETSYKILYRNSENTCFSVFGSINYRGASAYEEPSTYSFPVITKLLGKTHIVFDSRSGSTLVYQVPSPQQLNSPQSRMFAAFDAPSGEYIIGTDEQTDGCRVNQSLTPLELEKILQSLTWL